MLCLETLSVSDGGCSPQDGYRVSVPNGVQALWETEVTSREQNRIVAVAVLGGQSAACSHRR